MVQHEQESGPKKIVYTALNLPVIRQIPFTARQILDVGCGDGSLGKYLKRRQNCQVVGITYSKDEAQLAQTVLDGVFVDDLNTMETAGLGTFDCIVCSHVLEHLYYPQRLLKAFHTNLTPEGVLVIALPNVLNFNTRRQFLQGQFRYTDWGALDRTHYRFFDWETAKELLVETGYEVTIQQAQGMFPLSGLRHLLGKRLPGTLQMIDTMASQKWPNLFGLQFILIAKSAVNQKITL